MYIFFRLFFTSYWRPVYDVKAFYCHLITDRDWAIDQAFERMFFPKFLKMNFETFEEHYFSIYLLFLNIFLLLITVLFRISCHI